MCLGSRTRVRYPVHPQGRCCGSAWGGGGEVAHMVVGTPQRSPCGPLGLPGPVLLQVLVSHHPRWWVPPWADHVGKLDPSADRRNHVFTSPGGPGPKSTRAVP